MLRFLDFAFSFFGLIILSPLFVLISIWVKIDSKGAIFYRQKRVGLNGKEFKLFKFRSMSPDSDKLGLLTVGERDSRITKSGFFIRKYKLDELPQLINVIIGDMSLVGPRPEVKKYVELYTLDQLKVLNVRPGITDEASIVFKNENELLAQSNDPERKYIEEIIPTKLELNKRFIDSPTLINYFRVIFKTFFNY
ncbi:MAG: lipopolysaccharide/colanic/teichoic acid biosynthesis glycosyltransferase [Algoriphagus sp.]|jgi:lipopolysaccharide/colanic/teichoic acid biosynthesis glycosyltransferase